MKPEPRNLVLDLILTILLCGIWNLLVQHSQMKALNYLLRREKYSFWKVYLFSLLTFGIYFIYHEYQKAKDLAELSHQSPDGDTIIAVVLSVMALHFVFDAISQSKINLLLARE